MCQRGYTDGWSFVSVGMDLAIGFDSFVAGSLDIAAGCRDDPDCC